MLEIGIVLFAVSFLYIVIGLSCRVMGETVNPVSPWEMDKIRATCAEQVRIFNQISTWPPGLFVRIPEISQSFWPEERINIMQVYEWIRFRRFHDQSVDAPSLQADCFGEGSV